MGYRLVTDCFHFRGAIAPPAVASRQGTWCSKITAAGGSPTIKSGSGGAMELALDATNEVQNLCLYMGDVLPYDIDLIKRLRVLAKMSTASLAATVTAVIGLASARNDDPDAIAAAALFKLAGSNAVVLETDDGVINNDDVATGETLGTTYKWLTIDFSQGIQTVAPPGTCKGGKGSVGFAIDNAAGSHRAVAARTLFDMSNYSGNLQLFAQLQKTAATAVGTLSILQFEIDHHIPG